MFDVSNHQDHPTLRSAVLLSLPERLALVDAAIGQPASTRVRDTALIQLLLHTPLSLAELAALDGDAVDLDDMTIATAGAAVPVTDLLAEALGPLLAGAVDGPLLCGRAGERASVAELQQALDTIGADASGITLQR